MSDAGTARRFRVRAPDDDDHHGAIVTELNMHAAAVAWLERHAPFTPGKAAIRVTVLDLESGHEHWFHIALAPG
jgi:Family of unknown function (DUF5961)